MVNDTRRTPPCRYLTRFDWTNGVCRCRMIGCTLQTPSVVWGVYKIAASVFVCQLPHGSVAFARSAIYRLDFERISPALGLKMDLKSH